MNILDQRFKYVPAAKTDIRKTFAKARKEQREAAERAKHTQPVPIRKVSGGKP